MALVMEGYDTGLLGNFYELPQFNKRFGVPVGDGSYQVTSSWQSALQNGAQVGQILGLMIAGQLAARWGYKKALIGALTMMIAVIFIFFFAQNIGMLTIGALSVDVRGIAHTKYGLMVYAPARRCFVHSLSMDVATDVPLLQ